MTLALVHDWMNQIGGAEDVLEAMVDLYPQAPVFTSLYAPDKMPQHWRSWDIRTSFIDRLPFSHNRQQLYFPLYPVAFERFDFSNFDIVLSNKSGFCHGIKTGDKTLHICYCLTPTRYVWRYEQYVEQESIRWPMRTILKPFVRRLQHWDRMAAAGVDWFIAISEAVRGRIAQVYQRDSAIIYPPVDVQRFEPASSVDDYYLLVARLVPYRRVDLLIQAFNQLDRPLLIAGAGRDRQRLEEMAGPNITFLGYVPAEELPELYARARAFVFPGEEDFGIAPIQAMAAGRPVIAYAAGGALETVVPGTGRLFAEQTVTAIIQAVEEFDTNNVDVSRLRKQAEKFDTAVFKSKLNEFLERKLDNQHHRS